MQPGLLLAHGDSADHGTENEPWRRRILVAPAGQARRAPPTSPPSMRIASGQSKLIGFSGGACTASASASAVNAGIKRAPRGAQRLFGLQHDGEFGEIEAADMDQRAGAGIGGNLCRMREGVADLAQRHGAKRRRQIEGRRKRRRERGSANRAAFRHPGLALSTSYNYNLWWLVGQSHASERTARQFGTKWPSARKQSFCARARTRCRSMSVRCGAAAAARKSKSQANCAAPSSSAFAPPLPPARR